MTSDGKTVGAATALGDTLPGAVGPPGAGPLAGRVIAGRYRMAERLGEGGHGEVWAADDLVLREPVALKWMRFGSGPIRARIRREITTLRMLRVPGVVRLLDDGIEDGRAYLVMERAQGRPFPGSAPRRPGTPPRWSWASIVDPTLGLLEVLARVHAAGVVHRDLKPDNILVSAEGRPTVLDFGISLWSDQTGERLSEAGQILGTPLYLAPEQILGHASDARTDLYAVGVMLFEALTGRLPHEAPQIQAMLRARLLRPALPVRDLAPDLPAEVADAIDRLLATRVEDRFRSATELLAVLRGEPAAAKGAAALPRLGGGGPVEAVLEAVRAGRSIDVVGPPGSGRSRCLGDAAAALEQEGRRVAWTRPARAPLASLLPIVGALADDGGFGLAEMTSWVEGQLREALADGTIVLADDAEQIDPWSMAVLERCRALPGSIVRALPTAPVGASPSQFPPTMPIGASPSQLPPAMPIGASPSQLPNAMPAMTPAAPAEAAVVLLHPLDEAALMPLFAGPDRLLHLREDAARALWERTEGLPGPIEAEVTLWTRLGLARWDGAVLVMDRDALGRLSAGLPGATPVRAAPGSPEIEPHLEELLQWLALAGHHLQVGQLARVMGQPAWRLEAECEALVARGVARRLPGRRVAPRGQVDIAWPFPRRVEAHQAIAAALRPGQEGRLFHLLSADEVQEAAREAAEVARRRVAEGELAAASAALGEGLRAVRQQGEGGAEDEILAEWVKAALSEGTPHALDRVLYELTRAGRGAAIEQLEALVRAAISAPGASGMRAMELADAIPPFADPELERRRQRARVVAAAGRAWLSLLEEVLAEVAAWSARSGELHAALALSEGQAMLRYGQGRYEEAAALYARTAEQEPGLAGRIAATLSCASALLEAFQHREAANQAATACALAARCRHPYWEGRAEWLLRAAMYRMGEATAPDLELAEAAAMVHVPHLEGLVCFNEAAVAFRAGALGAGVDLAGRAVRIWKEMDRAGGAMLARCLALACGAAPDPGEVEALSTRAMQCQVPGIGAQALGLLGRAFPEARPDWRDAMPGLLEGVPREHWGKRMDVLSMAEAMEGALGEQAA